MQLSDLALVRFQAISAYLSLDPPRGKRREVLAALAAKTWHLPDGREVRFSAETLRAWVRRYRVLGPAGLDDAPRPKRGVAVLTPEQIETVCRLKRDVPERSLDRVLHIAADTGLIPAGVLSRSTVHRVLQAHGISGRPKPATTTTDLDRFEAVAPNDLWQSDMLAGPWLPDPERPGKLRRAWLYAFLDDHSRLLLAGRFAFKGDLPSLELVFREALRRHGVPRRLYYDNGATYRSVHMRQVCATLGVHRVVFTTPYRPEGHGKIEAFNRHCTAAFIAEVKASAIHDLDGLNLAFRAWVERYYNARVHGETNEAPFDRWKKAITSVRHADETELRNAFLWSEKRTPDKAGVLSLHGAKYQVQAGLGRKEVEVRFDPERMEQVEIWRDGKLVERVRPFEVQPHRRPRPKVVDAVDDGDREEPLVDFLGHLVSRREQDAFDVDDTLERALATRRADDDAIVEQLRARLSPDVFDEAVVRDFLDRFGPLDPGELVELVDLGIELGGADQHVRVLLEGALQGLTRGGR